MSSKAFTYLDTREVAKRTYQLLNDFVYYDSVYGPIRCRKSFTTNYASLDKLRNLALFPVYALLVDYGDKSCTVHDWLYRGYSIEREDGTLFRPSRKECDEILYRALRAEGIAEWRAKLFLQGVRNFGSSSYQSTKVFVPTEIAPPFTA